MIIKYSLSLFFVYLLMIVFNLSNSFAITYNCGNSNDFTNCDYGSQIHTIGLDAARKIYPKIDGSGVNLAIFDSGVDFTRPWFALTPPLNGNPVRSYLEYDFSSGNRNPTPFNPAGSNQDNDPLNSVMGHGSSAAAFSAGNGNTFMGVAPNANIILIREDGNNPQNYLNAYNWLINNHKSIPIAANGASTSPLSILNASGIFDENEYNVSPGMPNLTSYCQNRFPNSSCGGSDYCWQWCVNNANLNSTAEQVAQSGVFVARSAGNGNENNWNAWPSMAIVGGTTDDGSQMGPNGPSTILSGGGVAVNITAPESGIWRPWYSNNNPNSPIMVAPQYSGSETSWATPQVAGTAALLLQVNKNLTPDQILRILNQASGPWVWDANYSISYPVLNVKKALDIVCSEYSNPSLCNGNSGIPTPNLVPPPTPTPTTPTSGSVPFGPYGLTVTPVSASEIDLSWSNNNIGPAAMGYDVAINGNVIAINNSSATTYKATGLNSSTNYTFYVNAFNASGNSGKAGPVYVKTLTSTTPPQSPATTGSVPNGPWGLTAKAVSASEIDLSWYDNTSPGPVVNGYDVAINGNVIAINNSSATSYKATGLNPNTNYTFYVNAFNAAGNSGLAGPGIATTLTSTSTPSGSAPTSVPNGPWGLTAKVVSASEIDLIWYDNTSAGPAVTGYDVTINGANPIVINNSSAISYKATGLKSGTTYSFSVNAFNALGISSVTSANNIKL